MALTRCACIDIGTNTTRLLVADRTAHGLREVAAVRAFLPLGPHAPAAPAGSDSADTLAGVVERLLDAAREHRCERVRVVGTAALRGTRDAERLCRLVQERTGATVEILAPAEEARLAFRGATGTLPEPPGTEVAVVDVGGGSTEIAVGTVRGGVRWWTSMATGSAALTAAHVRSDPPGADELAAVRRAAAAALPAAGVPAVPVAYAVGGSAVSLPRLIGARLTPEAVERAVAALTAGPAEAIGREHGVDPRRVRMLPAGILLLAAVGQALGTTLVVARGGLREGIVLDTV